MQPTILTLAGDEAVPLDEVPQGVTAAALAAGPGFVVEVAEKELEDGVAVYCLQGTAAGEAIEIDLTADGEVLEVEPGEGDQEACGEGD